MNFFKHCFSEIQAIQTRCWDVSKQSEQYLNNIANWERIYFSRKISIWITYFLKDTRVTPNQVTAFWVIIGVIGAMLLISDSYAVQLLALAILYLSWLLDNVDGELARYRQQFSNTGNLMDMIGHQLIPATVFAGLGMHYLLQADPSPWLVSCAFLATAWVTAFNKMQDNVLLLLAIEHISRATNAKPKKPAEIQEKPKKPDLKALIKQAISLIFTDTAIFYTLILAVIFQKQEFYLLFYGLGLPLMMVPKIMARANALETISADPALLDAEFRPEWKDS